MVCFQHFYIVHQFGISIVHPVNLRIECDHALLYRCVLFCLWGLCCQGIVKVMCHPCIDNAKESPKSREKFIFHNIARLVPVQGWHCQLFHLVQGKTLIENITSPVRKNAILMTSWQSWIMTEAWFQLLSCCVVYTCIWMSRMDCSEEHGWLLIRNRTSCWISKFACD